MVSLSTLQAVYRAPYNLQWDEWIACPRVRQQRFVLAPAFSRLRSLTQSSSMTYTPFLEMDFRYVFQPNYDRDLQQALRQSILISSIAEIRWKPNQILRMEYDNLRKGRSMEEVMRVLGLQSHSRGGTYSWSYRGVGMVELANGVVVFVTCSQVWPCDSNAFSM